MAGITLPGGVTINNVPGFNPNFTDLGSVISALLPYVFVLAGLVMFFLLIAGGFQLLTSAGNPEATAKGYKRILFAIVGFLVVFISYWLIQILQYVLGITIF